MGFFQLEQINVTQFQVQMFFSVQNFEAVLFNMALPGNKEMELFSL